MPRKGGLFAKETYRNPERDRARGVAPQERLTQGELGTVRDALEAAGVDTEDYINAAAAKMKLPDDVRRFVLASLTENVSLTAPEGGRPKYVLAKEASAFLDDILIALFIAGRGGNMKTEGKNRGVKLGKYHTGDTDWED